MPPKIYSCDGPPNFAAGGTGRRPFLGATGGLPQYCPGFWESLSRKVNRDIKSCGFQRSIFYTLVHFFYQPRYPLKERRLAWAFMFFA
jgi:hypothetical protein